MSSVTNIIISAQGTAQAVPLGRLLGREGCAMFEQELIRLAEKQGSGWQRVPQTAGTYRVAVTGQLPVNVSDLTATVHVTPGVVEVKEHWTYTGAQTAPVQVSEAVRRMVNQTVNEPIRNVVVNGIQQRLRDRLKTEVKNRVLERTRVQVYAQVRAGGGR